MTSSPHCSPRSRDLRSCRRKARGYQPRSIRRTEPAPPPPPRRHRRHEVGRVVHPRALCSMWAGDAAARLSSEKSVISALTDVLPEPFKLDEPAPVAASENLGRSPPRHHRQPLLQARRGPRARFSLWASLGSALEPVNRMKFIEDDIAAYAAARMPLATARGADRSSATAKPSCSRT